MGLSISSLHDWERIFQMFLFFSMGIGFQSCYCIFLIFSNSYLLSSKTNLLRDFQKHKVTIKLTAKCFFVFSTFYWDFFCYYWSFKLFLFISSDLTVLIFFQGCSKRGSYGGSVGRTSASHLWHWWFESPFCSFFVVVVCSSSLWASSHNPLTCS